jgi:peptidoglycan lytic transglycosylase
MALRLYAAICGAAILFVCSSSAMAKLGTLGKSTAASRYDGCASSHDKKRCIAARASIGVTIVGTASIYDPFQPGYDEGGIQTASGELYDPIAWTAAIQIGLRETFGGVRHGKDYRPAYALIEVAHKRAIIKINDVGPLKPGRVIDLNKRTMRYFDPTLERGLVHSVRITPLPGDSWETGPINVE